MKEIKPKIHEIAAVQQDQCEFSGYLQEVNKTAPLTIEEEISLGHSIRHDRCPAARAQLMRANLRLVISIASKFTNRGIPARTLIEEGNIGLAWAVEEFDSNLGVRFSTFASWWIKHAIRRLVLACAGQDHNESTLPGSTSPG